MPGKIAKTHFNRVRDSRGKRLVRAMKKEASRYSATGDLVNSIRYERVDEPGKSGIKIIYNSYGEVLDKGLKGYDGKIASPFQAGNGKLPRGLEQRSARAGRGTIPVRYQSVARWVNAKGIKFPGRSDNQTKYLVHRGIKRYGYPATRWLRRTKNAMMPGIQRDLVNAYRKDMAFFITQNLIK